MLITPSIKEHQLDMNQLRHQLGTNQGVKGTEEENSPLEETLLKRNPHLMVTRRNEKRKEIWCVSSAKNRDTSNMIVLSTKVKPREE